MGVLLQEKAMKKLMTICLVALFCANNATAGTFTALDYPGSQCSAAQGISGNSIVGTYGVYNGFIYNTTTKAWTPLNMSGAETYPCGIDGSKIVGSCRYSDGIYHGFSYSSGIFTTLDYPGANMTSAEGISGNNIVGNYQDYNGNNHGFLYNGTSYTTIEPLYASYSDASGISGNNIVGTYNGQYGFLYNIGTSKWTDLDYPGAIDTYPQGISGNNIVGRYYNSSGYHGFLYDGTTWTTLNYPGQNETSAEGISGNSIVGWTGSYWDPSYPYNVQGFVYTVPEPSTMVLLITALTGTLFLRRKK